LLNGRANYRFCPFMVMPALSRIRWELSFGGHHSPSPNIIFGKARTTTPFARQANSTVRAREHVSPDEVERLIVAARRLSAGGWPNDALLIMMVYHHALRASEIAGLRWHQIDLKAGGLPEAPIVRCQQFPAKGATAGDVFTNCGKELSHSPSAREAQLTGGAVFP
jgi:hypothetical protein